MTIARLITKHLFILLQITDIENIQSTLPLGNTQSKWNPFDDTILRSVHSSLQSNDVGHQSIDTNTFLIRSHAAELHEIISRCHTARKSLNICVQGVAGTGKTCAVHWIQKQLQARKDVIFSYVNAYRVSHNKENFSCARKLAQQISPSQNENKRLADIIVNSDTNKKLHVLVIDEIDHLSDSELEDFYKICCSNNTWCVCIGISNILNFTESSRINRLTSMGIPQPKRISFNALDSTEILNILHRRIAKIPYSVFADESLVQISKLVANRSGDVRIALKLAEEAVHNCLQRLRNKQDPDDDVLVRCIDVSKSAHNLKAHNLTIPQAMILKTLYHSNKRQFDKSQLFAFMLAYNAERDAYKRWRCLKKCDVLEIKGESELLSLCDALVCLGHLQEIAVRSNTFIRLSMSDVDVELILRQKKLI